MSKSEGYRIRLGLLENRAEELVGLSSPRNLQLGLAQFLSSPMAYRGSGTPNKRQNDTIRLIVSTACVLLVGIFVGTFVGLFLAKAGLSSRFDNSVFDDYNETSNRDCLLNGSESPRGTKGLPPGIIVGESDLYQRRLYGDPARDLPQFPSRYLVTFTVGVKQKSAVNLAVAKFPMEWTIMLFHYDGKMDDWNEFEWSKTAIHVSAPKQTKWWFAKRFLHPDIVSTFDYIFIWDEDLGVEHFNAAQYIQLVKKHGLEISQPAVEPTTSWQMPQRRNSGEVHRTTQERPGWCSDPHLPPCAGFIEIQAPVFSRKAWRCVWHLIQNDLVHGWGLDFTMQRCVEPAYEKMGVVDAQWIHHNSVPSLGSQGTAVDGKKPWEAVRERCMNEWHIYTQRLDAADKDMEENGENSTGR